MCSASIGRGSSEVAARDRWTDRRRAHDRARLASRRPPGLERVPRPGRAPAGGAGLIDLGRCDRRGDRRRQRHRSRARRCLRGRRLLRRRRRHRRRRGRDRGRARWRRPAAARLAVVVDVTDAESVRRLAGAAFDFGSGTVEVLCNNAGVLLWGDALVATQDDWAWILDVNVMGVVNGIRAFLPRMVEQGSAAHIVNTASIAAPARRRGDGRLRRLQSRRAVAVGGTARAARRHRHRRERAVPFQHREPHPRCAAQPATGSRDPGRRTDGHRTAGRRASTPPTSPRRRSMPSATASCTCSRTRATSASSRARWPSSDSRRILEAIDLGAVER